MSTDSAPLLDLTTKTQRAVIKIDDEAHEMLNPEDLSFADDAERIQVQQSLGTFFDKGFDDLSKEERVEISDLLDRHVRLILPDAPHERLNDTQRIQIFETFLSSLRDRVEADGQEAP